MKHDLDLLTKPLYQLMSKEESKLTKAQISKISKLNNSFFQNDKELKDNQLEINELHKNIENLKGNESTLEIKEIIDEVKLALSKTKKV